MHAVVLFGPEAAFCRSVDAAALKGATSVLQRIDEGVSNELTLLSWIHTSFVKKGFDS